MYKKRIGVIRGGPSSEYEVSLKTGQSVLEALSSVGRYDVRDIFIDKNGEWHVRGFPVAPLRALDQVDVVFIGLHGKYGEDGILQRFFDTHGIRYVGSGSLASALAMNKVLAKEHLKEAPYKHPLHRVFDHDVTERDLVDLFRTFPQPCVVKPINGGSSVGTTLARSFADLRRAIVSALMYGERVLVEQYVRGREVTVAVADGFRGEAVYGFPPIEISYGKNEFFDYEEKYSGIARELCPAPFAREVTQALIDSARHVHTTLGLRDYSRSDFIVAKDGVYFLEVNTLPGMTTESLVPKAVNAVGATLPLFLEHLVERAYSRK